MEQFYVFWGYPLSWKANFYLFILMLVILIINIYSIVTSLQELVVLTKSASEYCFVAINHWYFRQACKISVKSFCTIVTHNSEKKEK